MGMIVGSGFFEEGYHDHNDVDSCPEPEKISPEQSQIIYLNKVIKELRNKLENQESGYSIQIKEMAVKLKFSELQLKNFEELYKDSLREMGLKTLTELEKENKDFKAENKRLIYVMSELK